MLLEVCGSSDSASACVSTSVWCVCVCVCFKMCIILSSLLLVQRQPISAFFSVQLEEFSQHVSEDDATSAGALVPVNSAQ